MAIFLMVVQPFLPGLTIVHAHDVPAPIMKDEQEAAQPVPSSRHFHVHFLPFGTSHHHHHHHHHDCDTGNHDFDDHKDDQQSNGPSAPANENDENAFPCTMAFLAMDHVSPDSVLSLRNLQAFLSWACAQLPAFAGNIYEFPERQPPDPGADCAQSPPYLSTLHLLI